MQLNIRGCPWGGADVGCKNIHSLLPALHNPPQCDTQMSLSPLNRIFLTNKIRDNNTVDSFPSQVVLDTISGCVHKSVQKSDESESGQS